MKAIIDRIKLLNGHGWAIIVAAVLLAAVDAFNGPAFSGASSQPSGGAIIIPPWLLSILASWAAVNRTTDHR